MAHFDHRHRLPGNRAFEEAWDADQARRSKEALAAWDADLAANPDPYGHSADVAQRIADEVAVVEQAAWNARWFNRPVGSIAILIVVFAALIGLATAVS